MTPSTDRRVSALLQLAERCEKATGPDRRLDGLIFVALNPDKRIIIGSVPGRFPQKPIYGTPRDLIPMLEEGNGKDAAEYLGAPEVTASLDAAMQLVPEGCHFRCGSAHYGGFARIDTIDAPEDYTRAATPALALAAAALRARAAS